MKLLVLITLFIFFNLNAFGFEDEKRNQAFFDGFWLREKYSPTLLKKKYFDYEYQFIEKTFIEGPPTHQFRQGNVNKKFVFETEGENRLKLRFIKFDNVYDFEDVIAFYDLFSEKYGEADLVYTKDYFWTKGFRAEWVRDDGMTTEILDATYHETVNGISYEVSHYFFDNSYQRKIEDLRIPVSKEGIQYKTFDIQKERDLYVDRPVIKNRPIQSGTSFELTLGGIDISKNLSFDSLPNTFPGVELTSDRRDFDQYRYVSFDYESVSFEMEYHFEESGQVSTIFIRNLPIGQSHILLNQILQSNSQPDLAYTRRYKRQVRQPENWLFYLNKQTKQMAVVRLSQDFIDPHRFQISIDIRDYDEAPKIPKETLTYEHHKM